MAAGTSRGFGFPAEGKHHKKIIDPNTTTAFSPPHAPWMVGRQTLPWDYVKVVRYSGRIRVPETLFPPFWIGLRNHKGKYPATRPHFVKEFPIVPPNLPGTSAGKR
jgi:hypothetical protein